MTAITVFATRIVRADQMDKKIIVSFSKPVEIPNLVLQAGTYVFKLAGHGNIPNVVQVYNEDESQIYASLLTIPKYRDTVTDQPEFQLEESNQGEPTAIDAWFYPGENTGYEFVYSKGSHVHSAPEAAANITPDNIVAAPAPSEPTAHPPESDVIETIRIVVFFATPEAPAPDPIVAAENSTAPSEPVTTTAAAQPKELPKTASRLPLLALFGMLSLGSAATLQAVEDACQPLSRQ